MLTLERLRELLVYHPDNGDFIWKAVERERGRKDHGGMVAGRLTSAGYIQIGIDKRFYLAHRLAFFWMTGAWPTSTMDHVDGVKVNNRWTNLREASRSENNINCGKPKSNTSGRKGVTYDPARRKWKAYIGVNGKKRHLGYFTDLETAAEAYAAAAKHYFGAFVPPVG